MTQRDLPCTPMQAGLVFEALAGGAGTYLQQSIIRLHEPVDVTALRRAWEGAVARNWALRSSFAVGAEAAPTLRVEDGVEVPLVVLDWTDRDGSAQEERFAELLRADRATGFDPTTPPLMRLVLCRLGPTESRLVWSYHHAIIDGRSRVLILRELFDAYEGRDVTADRPGPDAFAAFARWTNERAGDAEALAFWEHALRHASPTPSPRRPDPPEEPGARSLRLSRPLSDALRALAEAHDLTVATVLQGAFALVLGQETGLADLVYGTTRAGRRSAPMPTDAIVGMLLATTPVRARIDPRQALVDWLGDLRAFSLAVRPYEHVPLAAIQHVCGIAAPEQVVRTLFVYENASMAAQLGRDIDLLERLNYGLTVNAYGDERLLVKALYDGEGTSAASAERFLERLEQVLGEIAASSSGTRVGDLAALPADERRRLSGELVAFAPPGPDELAPALFARRAREHPDRPAVQAGEETATYGELDARAGGLAARLAALGVERETRVAIATERTLDLVAAVLAVHRAGAAYVPLDPRYPPERLAFMLADSGARIVLTDAASADRLPAEAAVEVLRVDAATTAAPTDAPASAPTDLSHVIYTSGSTGRPKGTLIEHGAVAALTRWARETFSDRERDGVLASTSLSFDLSVFELLVTLALGGRVVLVPDLLALADPGFDASVALVNSVPSALSALLRVRPLPEGVTTVALAGEALPQTLVDRLHEHPSVEAVWNLYGPSEDTTYSTAALCAWGEPGPPPIGRPLPGTQAYVLDASRRTVPVGVSGELYLGGAGLARGYLDRPELTAERFVANPFPDAPTPRLYRTGDRAVWRPDGRLEYRGRLDDQVKLRGFRIEPGEVRETLLEDNDVADAAVVVRGEGEDRRLVAYAVAPTGTTTIDPQRVRRTLADRLPAHLVPSAVVALDRLPVTRNGKLDTAALPAPLARAPETTARTPTEAALADIWAELLDLDARPGPEDDFFVLGGHSLLVLRLLAAIEERLGSRPSVASIYRATTVRALALDIDTRQAELDTSTVIPVRPSGTRPPWFCVYTDARGVVALRNVLPALLADQPVYALSAIDPRDPTWRVSSVHAIARARVDALVKQVPDGPLRLGGHSLGGLVAFEMACLLEEAGREVEILTLLDTSSPRPGTVIDRLAFRTAQPRDRRRFSPDHPPLGPAKWYGDFLIEEGRLLRWRYENLRSLRAARAARAEMQAPRGFSDPFDLWGARRLQLTMRPRRYHGRVVLFRTSGSVTMWRGPDLGWSRWTARPPELVDVPGDHVTMLSQAEVAELAASLADTLQSLDRA